MEALKTVLLQTEDEYLTGLSNKGTVKRAYKDLAGESPSVRWQEEGAEVRLKDAVCQIRVPLGSSSCSCPSRSICRHRIAAILYLKQELEQERTTSSEHRMDEDPKTATLDEKAGTEAAGDSGIAEPERMESTGTTDTKRDQDLLEKAVFGKPADQSRIDAGDQADSEKAAAGGGIDSEKSDQKQTAQEQTDQKPAGQKPAVHGELTKSKKSQKGDREDTGSPEDSTGNESERRQAAEPLLQEIAALSPASLRKKCRSKSALEMLAGMKHGVWPEIQWGIVTTVIFPQESVAVKLLHPLEYSSCSCRSKRMCSHKIQAMLAAGLAAGIWSMEETEPEQKETAAFKEQLEQTVASVRKVLLLQLETGIARLSPEAGESMERLAVLSHRARLPALERECRAAATGYQLYFERKAAFRMEAFTEQLLKLYHRTVQLEETADPEIFQRLAGSFRETYVSLPRLQLTAIGAGSIKSKTGYEGDCYYFLEAEQGKWYTWTDARPVFYEGARRRSSNQLGREAAPWGLGCSREQMLEMEFVLEQGKATEDGRLSVSQETKGVLLGIRNLKKEKIADMVFWDYRRLLEKVFFRQPEKTERSGEHLVLAGVCRVQDPLFDQIEQRFTMKLLDQQGRSIRVAVRYTEEEKMTIRILERLVRRLEERGQEQLVFFGSAYLEQGELYLYPIDFFRRNEIYGSEMPQKGTGQNRPVQDAPESEASGQRVSDPNASEPNTPEPEASGQRVSDPDASEPNTPESEASAQGMQDQRVCDQEGSDQKPSVHILWQMESFCLEVREISSAMFQCGLHSVQEETIQEMQRLSQESQELGLYLLGQELGVLADAMEKKRHGAEWKPEPVMASWIRLAACLAFCMEKIERDSCRNRMESMEGAFGANDGDIADMS